MRISACDGDWVQGGPKVLLRMLDKPSRKHKHASKAESGVAPHEAPATFLIVRCVRALIANPYSRAAVIDEQRSKILSRVAYEAFTSPNMQLVQEVGGFLRLC